MIKLDKKGAHRGWQLEDWGEGHGVEVQAVPAESHGQIGQVERLIGTLKRKMLAHLRSSDGSPEVAAWAMIGAHNTMSNVGGYSPCQWVFGRNFSDSLMDMTFPTGLAWHLQRRCNTNFYVVKIPKNTIASLSCGRKPTWPTTPRWRWRDMTLVPCSNRSATSHLQIAMNDLTNLWMCRDGEWPDGMVQLECWQLKRRFLMMVLHGNLTMWLGSSLLDASRGRFTPTNYV